ncbi:MAG: hypothetical protein MJ137_06935 [Clostridia bacterium]|nr:hypothetical protein [Clostridia bacterium]
MKKALCIMLALLMLTSVIGCAEKGNTDDSSAAITTPGASVDDTVPAGDTELKDSVPTLNFGGEEFVILMQGDADDIRDTMWAESVSGDYLEDAFFNRQLYIESRFNVAFIKPIAKEFNQVSSMLGADFSSGDGAYSLVMNQMYRSGADAIKGWCSNWNDIPYVNPKNPWYNAATLDCSIGNKLYLLVSDFSLSYIGQIWMILLNRDMADDYNIPDLYAMAKDGSWTLEKLNEYASLVYEDNNKDGKKNLGDTFGFYTSVKSGCEMAAWLYAFGGDIGTLNDNEFTITLDSEKNIDILNKISELALKNPGSYDSGSQGSDLRRTIFPSGNFLFATAQIRDVLFPEFRSMEDKFSVLPLPKLNADQADYVTVCDGGASVLTAPYNCSNKEMLGALVEALSWYSYKEIVPLYTGIGLENKGVRDAEGAEMMRKIIDSVRIDFAYMYDNSQGFVMQLASMVASPSTISSSVRVGSKVKQKYYDGIIAAYVGE